MAKERANNTDPRVLLAGYAAMSADEEREREADAWSEALLADAAEAIDAGEI
jgi:hypothetical protein